MRNFFQSLLYNVTSSTEDIVPTVDSATLFCSNQVDLLIWGGNSALNSACSLWQYYLWTVVGHTVFWGCQMLNLQMSKIWCKDKHFARVSFASSPFWHKWGCGHPPPFPLVTRTKKQTQLTEQFAPIKHSMRAFKEFTCSHR